MELKTQIVEMDNSSKFQNAIQWFKYKTEMWNCWTDLKFNYQNCWRRNLHDHTIKSQSISHQYQINIFNQYPIHFSNQHFNQHPINILHEQMIEMLIVKSTYQINVWEDQHIVCNHFNARIIQQWAKKITKTITRENQKETSKIHNFSQTKKTLKTLEISFWFSRFFKIKKIIGV